MIHHPSLKPHPRREENATCCDYSAPYWEAKIPLIARMELILDQGHHLHSNLPSHLAETQHSTCVEEEVGAYKAVPEAEVENVCPRDWDANLAEVGRYYYLLLRWMKSCLPVDWETV
jgi:hypothetical protein